jgi:oxygen-independent coproporphyrinogen III oxidase
LIAGGVRYHANVVPTDDAIVRMYETALESLEGAGLRQYEISNFARPGFESRHNLRYWQRRAYLGLGLDASSMLRATPRSSDTGELRYVLRSTTTDDLKSYLDAAPPPETAWLSPERQHEEAWFLGLRLNAGVFIPALREEFGNRMVAHALDTVGRLAERGLVAFDGEWVRLTAQGRLLSNDVFQEFLEIADPHAIVAAS